MLLAADEVVAALDWSQFGLAGMVIGALFASVFYIIRVAREHGKHLESRHYEERKDWRELVDKRDVRSEAQSERVRESMDKVVIVVDKLTDAVKDTKGR